MNSTTRRQFPLQYAAIIFIACVSLVALISAWRTSPKYSAQEMVIREQEFMAHLQEQWHAQDQVELQGTCDKAAVKTLKSGLVAICDKDQKWQIPTTIESSTLQSSSSSVKREPCLHPPGSTPGLVATCTYTRDGKIETMSIPTTN